MEQAVANAMEEVAKKVNTRVENKWAAQKGIKGRAKAYAPKMSIPTPSIIEATLSYDGQKAWISEFGKGSLTDTSKDNEWLDRYKNSASFNPARLKPLNSATKQLSVVSRKPGESYRDLDGHIHTATDKFPREGFNLEWWAARSRGKPYRKGFKPLPPLHTVHDEVKATTPEFGNAINTAIKEWLKYNLLK